MLGRKGNSEKGRGRAAAQGKAQLSPASSRNVYLLASHVHANLWQNQDEEFERFRGRKGKAQPKTHAVNFEIFADIGRKKAMRKTPKKDENFKRAAALLNRPAVQ